MFSALFANLNESIETFHHTIQALHRPKTILETLVLDSATEFRDVLYTRYDALAGVAKAFPLKWTRKTLKALQKIFDVSKVPLFYDTIDIENNEDKKNDYDKEDWTVPFVRKHSGNPSRVRDPDDPNDPQKIVLPSVKCDAYATAIIALSLILFPQKKIINNDNKNNNLTRRNSFAKHSTESGDTYVHIQNKGDWKDKTWEKSFTKKEKGEQKLTELCEWWKVNSKEKLEDLWKNIWRPAIDGLKSHGNILDRISLWKAHKDSIQNLDNLFQLSLSNLYYLYLYHIF